MTSFFMTWSYESAFEMDLSLFEQSFFNVDGILMATEGAFFGSLDLHFSMLVLAQASAL